MPSLTPRKRLHDDENAGTTARVRTPISNTFSFIPSIHVVDNCVCIRWHPSSIKPESWFLPNNVLCSPGWYVTVFSFLFIIRSWLIPHATPLAWVRVQYAQLLIPRDAGVIGAGSCGGYGWPDNQFTSRNNFDQWLSQGSLSSLLYFDRFRP